MFDFVFTFAGVSTLHTVVAPALNRFIENVYVYDMKVWDALQQSFGEDRHALNSVPVMVSFADITTGINNTRQRVVDTRVLAYNNLQDGRPWGFDIYRCPGCEGPAYNIIFHCDGKQFYGRKWLQTKMKLTCLSCGFTRRGIACPEWVNLAGGENYGRVWYRWPLSLAQRQEIGHKN